MRTATVPLEDLYDGREEMEFHCERRRQRYSVGSQEFPFLFLEPSFVFADRCLAAYRGGLLLPIVLRGLVPSVGAWAQLEMRTLRLRHRQRRHMVSSVERLVPLVVSLIVFGSLVFTGIEAEVPPLPVPDRIYSADVAKGCRGGKELRFRYSGVPRLYGDDDDDGGCDEEGDTSGDGRADVTFVIREERHPDYKRVGDDLLITVRARSKDLRRGCVLRVPSLSASI